MAHALVTSSWLPARGEPSHRSEMVTQWLCGEVLEVRERQKGSGNWLRCRGPDGYEAWTGEGGLLEVSVAEAETWRREATATSLGTRLMESRTLPPAELVAGISRKAENLTQRSRAFPKQLPWGCRLILREDGAVGLPDGSTAWPANPDAIISDAQRPAGFPPDGEALVATALGWLGAPYLWGGRTEWGVDCSGLVQAVFGIHGVALPRDSALQSEVGRRTACTDVTRHLPPTAAGDLLFFAPEGQGITHVAISAGEGRIVHAAASNGCVAVDDLKGAQGLERRLLAGLVTVTRPLAAF